MLWAQVIHFARAQSFDESQPICGANRSRPRRICVPAHHKQPYSQVVLKIRFVTGEPSRIGRFAPRENMQVGGCCNCSGNGKGCDIGYAPAPCSCERADSVDACTVAALDAIAAFAVPNPSSSSQSQPVFSGSVALQVTLPSRSLSLLSDWQGLFRQSFQPSTRDKLNSCLIDVNAILCVKTKYL